MTPPDEELHKLGKELVEWATAKDPKRLHITQWHLLEKGISGDVWLKWLEKPVFRRYYEKALRALSIKYIDGTVNPSIAQRFLRLYFKDLRDEENDTMKMKAELQKKVDDSKDSMNELADAIIKMSKKNE